MGKWNGEGMGRGRGRSVYKQPGARVDEDRTTQTGGIPSTGCSITPCSAISQASCQSPDDRRGAALPQEDVGDMLV